MKAKMLVFVLVLLMIATPLATFNGNIGFEKGTRVGGGVPPSISITSPSNGDAVKPSTELTINVSYCAGNFPVDENGVITYRDDAAKEVDIYVNGNKIYSTNPYDYKGTVSTTYTTPSYQEDLNISATVIPETNPSKSTYIHVDVVNDNTPPTVSITSPSSGEWLRRTVEIQANATDNYEMGYVNFYVNNTEIGTSSSLPYETSWNTTTVSDGTYTIKAVAYDKVGNSDSTSITVNVDNTPPSISWYAPANNSWVGGTITLETTASDSGSGIKEVEYFLNSTSGEELGSSTDASTHYAVSFDTSSLSGTFKVYAVAIDVAGNENVSYITLNKDNTPPIVSIASPTGNYVGGTVNVVADVSDNESGVAKVVFYVDSTSNSTSYTSTAAPYQFSWNTQGLSGSHTIYAVAYDNAGNSATASKTYNVDNTPPVITISSPISSHYYRGTISISASASDGSSGVASMTVSIDGTEVQSSSSSTISYLWNTSKVSDGQHTITITATDNVGNKATSTVYITVDNTPPEPFSLTAPANNTLTNTNSITFSWTGSNDNTTGIASYTLVIWNTTSGQYLNQTGITSDSKSGVYLGDGKYGWYVIAYDKVGNARRSSQVYYLTIDTTGVSVSLSVSNNYFSPNGDGHYDTTTLNASTKDGSTVSWYVEIYSTSNVLEKTYKPADGSSFSWTWDGTNNNGDILPTGTYTFKVYAKDNAGNNNSFTISTTIDLNPPAAFSLTSPDNNTDTNTATPTFKWASTTDGESGLMKYELFISKTVPTSYLSADYEFNITSGETFTLPSALEDGTYYWWVVAWDKVYNYRVDTNSGSSSYWKLTIDTTPPTFNSVSVSPYWYSPNNDGYHDILYINATTDEEVHWDVQIYSANGSDIYNYPISIGTNFYQTYGGQLPNGIYYVKLIITDDAGNENTQNITFVDDTTPMPPPELLAPANHAYLNTSTVQIKWDNAPADNSTNAWMKDVLEVFTANGTLMATSTQTERGTDYMSYSCTLPDGVYQYHVIRYDKAGNVVDSGYNTFTVDTTPPTRPVLLAPANNTLTNEKVVNFTWEAPQDATPLTYYLNLYYASTGQLYETFKTTNTYYNVNLSVISTQASFLWNVSVVDSAGNGNKSAETWILYIDHDKPTFTYTLSSNYISPNGDGKLDSLWVNTTSTSHGGENLKWKFVVIAPSGTAVYEKESVAYSSYYSFNWQGQNSNNTIVPDGHYTIEITAYDDAGNYNTSFAGVYVDDTPPPAPEITAPANGTYIASANVNMTWAWNGNVSDVNNATLFVYNSTGIYLETHITTSSTFLNTNLPDGSYKVYILVEDRADNINMSSPIYFTIDTTPPSTFNLTYPIGEYLNSTSINLSWSMSNDTNFDKYIVHYLYDGVWHTLNCTENHAVISFPEGEYNITWYVVAVDRAGNTRTSNTGMFYIDTEAPRGIYNVAPQGTLNNTNNITFSWTSANDTYFSHYILRIYNNGTVIYEENTTNTSIIVPVENGYYTWDVVAVDKAGNKNASAFWSIYVDTTPPSPFDLLSPNGIYFANSSAIALTWTPSSDEFFSHYLVVLYYNGTYHNFTAENNTMYVSLPDGEYQVEWYVKAIDKANNSRRSNETYMFYVDTEAPRNLTAKEPSGLWNSTSIVNFTWNAATDKYFSHYIVFVLRDGKVIFTANTTNTWISTTLGDGNYTWYVEAVDKAGNTAKTSPISFFVDANPPEVSGYISKQYYNSTVPMWINATDGNGTGVEYIYVYYTWNGGTWILYNKYVGSTTHVELTFSNAGFYQIGLVAEDYAGHKSTLKVSLSFTIDKTPPSGSVELNGGSTYTANGTVLVNLTYSDNYGVQYYRYRVDGGNWSDWMIINTTVSGSREFWLTLPHVEGNHTVDVEYMDVANNTSPVYSDSITEDLYAPIYENGNIAPHYSGNGNATVWLNATDNVSGVAWIYYSFDGANWTKIAYSNHFNISYALAEGKVNVYIVLQDYVGHNSSVISLNYTVDLTPPTGSLKVEPVYSSLNITIYLNATDNITWVHYFRYSIDNSTWSGWIVYNSSNTSYIINVGSAGEHTILVEYEDAVGHVSAVYSATTIVSIVPPALNFTVKNATANNTVGWKNITLSINASSDVPVEKMRIVLSRGNETLFDSGWIDYNTTYMLEINATGYYNITVYVMDEAGKTANSTLAIYDDLSPPLITSIEVKHYLIYDNETNITINATDFSGIARWGYEFNGTMHWFNTSTFTILLPSREGNYTLTLYVKDIFGNVAQRQVWLYEIRHKPVGTVSVSEHMTGNETVILKLNATDSMFQIVGFYLKIGNGKWNYHNFTSTYPLSFTRDGNYTIYVRYITNLGVESNETSTWVMVDTAPPTTSISGIPEYTDARNISFEVSGNDSLSGLAYYKIYYRYNGGAWQFYETLKASDSVVNFTFAQAGTYEFSVVGYDKVGNHEEITTKATVVVDWTPPTLVVNGKNETLTNTFYYNLSWNATDNSGIAYYLILIYKGNLTRAEPWKVINTTATSISVRLDNNATYIIELRAYDDAGNYVEKTLKVEMDYNFPPVIEKVDSPNSTSAGQETTFYASATDYNGDSLNYTWLINNKTVGYGQYLKYDFKKVGNYTITLVVSDGVHNVTRTWNITVAQSAIHGRGKNTGSPDIFMDLIFPILLLIALLVVILLVIILLIKKRKGGEEQEEGLSEGELMLLNGVKEYLEKHNGEKIENVAKAVADKLEVEERDIYMIVDVGESKGIFTKETDTDGNMRLYIASKNIELEEKDDGGN